MFYMQLLVSKKGPLAKIWLAAHWEKKLTKAHVFECNLERTVEKLISPKFTVALRTSGHLLLGVVRIYYRKAKYLLADCSEALTKMRTAFRPGLVDLPEESFEAAYQAITLPEEFHDFETPLPDLNAIDVAEHFTLNQSRAEDITFTEENESNTLLCHRDFEGQPEALRKNSFFDGSISTSNNSLLVPDPNSASMSGHKSVLQENFYSLENDCFGDEEDAADMIEILLRDEQNGLEKDILEEEKEEEYPLSPELVPDNTMNCEFAANGADTTLKDTSHQLDETVLWLKEEEGFVLQPVVDTADTQQNKTKRKRKLHVDVIKELSCKAIYNQLQECPDILLTLELAPPTKKTMVWKEWGGGENLLAGFAQPVGHPLLETVPLGSSGRLGQLGIGGRRSWEELQPDPGLHCGQNSNKMKLQLFRVACFKNLNSGLLYLIHSSYPSLCAEVLEANKCKHLFLQLFAKCFKSHGFKELVHSETEEKTGSDSLMLMSEDSRQEPEDNSSETRVSSFHQFERPPCPLISRDKEPVRIGKDSEEIKWSKRALHLLKTLQVLELRPGVNSTSFLELSRKSSRKEAAAKFHALLVLKKQLVLELGQNMPFGDITATPGPLFPEI
ncbi:RD21L protein, partial [Alcedo cyanopectus]|nr:RD21L protein [Ceyx cyanopectus]